MDASLFSNLENARATAHDLLNEPLKKKQHELAAILPVQLGNEYAQRCNKRADFVTV